MTPEQKCVSLETAKKLKEAGWDKETEREWRLVVKREFIRPKVEKTWQLWSFAHADTVDGEWGLESEEVIAAPDAQEIADELPTHFDSGRNTDGQWGCRVYYTKGKAGWYECLGENEQEACAKAWLRLKEDNLI